MWPWARPDFMAPEALQDTGQVDHRADLYAVGVMLYFMLTGQLPRGRFQPLSRAVPNLDKRLDVIVDRALQTDREARYSSAVELRSAMESILRRTGTAAASAGSGKAPSRKTFLLGMLAALLLSLAGFGWWTLKGRRASLLERRGSGHLRYRCLTRPRRRQNFLPPPRPRHS